MEWLRARDPGLAAVRRSARVTVVACAGFYAARYGLGDRTVAIYALFGAVAMGGLSSVPGTPRQRARTLLAVLPIAMGLVTLGTWLAVYGWAAALGMLVVGFLVTYSGVGGPKLVGLANGLQLFYILSCFPPYAPSTLGLRLSGLAVGVVLMAAAELWLWPAACPGRYEDRLARAGRVAADALYGLAADPPRRSDPALLLEVSQALRMSQVPTDERPVSASARDRALSEGAGHMRHLLAQTRQLVESVEEGAALAEPAAKGMLVASAASCGDVARALAGKAPPPRQSLCGAAVRGFESHRVRLGEAGTDSATMVRNGAIALDITHTADLVVMAVRIVVGASMPAGTASPEVRGAFWYAGRSTAELYYWRVLAHLTPRSVCFQNAVRVAVALAAVRLVVGELGLAHGFWALLTTLTVMRTSAADTRTALRPALRGTLAGAVVAALILHFAVDTPAVYAVMLPPCMLLAFASGSVLGPGWSQAFFTLTVATAFSQVARSGPELAAARVLDVLAGALVGAFIGLLAWPHGGTSELRRACARVLDQGTRAVTDVTDTITEGARATDALPRVRLAQRIAEASYAQYATERHAPRREGAASDTDFQVIMLVGNRVITMGQVLLDNGPPGALSSWPLSAAHLRDAAHRLRLSTLPFSYDLRSGRDRPAPVDGHADDAPADSTVIHDVCLASAGRAPDPLLYYAVDAAIWLASLQRAIGAARTPRAVISTKTSPWR
ncbi:FUSC family protein [Streptomyces sp. NBC_01637]|uniref:FUSC family protein n=1 Tax=unclassified Streptomyces TaxID=2593676 RepID=UPI0038650E44|nr:FUSC family protein [Streptomyces sp. NBC_01653]WTC84622.1 FUSC family protein [Streptomyces sp. NBC_01653]WTD86246.1 FUSC family protein [Streptomyces sp. NBC_01637]WTD94279.1 FUSC family protein [Streptomyces sp. NBC_01637]